MTILVGPYIHTLVTSWLTQQSKDRRVPTTGSTTLMFTPGITVQNLPFAPNTAAYVNIQIPVVRDFNNNLAQDVSFIFCISHFFNLLDDNA